MMLENTNACVSTDRAAMNILETDNKMDNDYKETVKAFVHSKTRN